MSKYIGLIEWKNYTKFEFSFKHNVILLKCNMKKGIEDLNTILNSKFLRKKSC